MEGFTTQKFYPLRPIQRWLVDTHFNKAKSTMMNIGVLLKMSASIDMYRLASALNQVLHSHDIFRCRFLFHPETSYLCQIFDGEITPVQVETLSDEEFSARMEKLREPYRIINKQLWRIYLFQTPTSKYMFADFYHAVMDGVSASILLWREIDAVYRGRRRELPTPSYADYVEEEANIPSEVLEEGHKYWKDMLSHFDKRRHLPPVNVQGVAAWTKGSIEYRLKNIFNEFFRTTHINENNFFLGATMLTLAKITGNKDVIMSRVNNGRVNMKERRLMGLMLEQLPCAWDFSQDIMISEFLDKLEGQIRTGTRYRKSLDVVYNEGLEDDCVSFIFQKQINNGFVFCDTPVEIVYLPPNDISAVENALDVEINTEDTGTYLLFLDYDASRYSEDEMNKFAKTLDEVVRAMQNTSLHVSQILG